MSSDKEIFMAETEAVPCSITEIGMQKFHSFVSLFGYRAVTVHDLKPRAELLMVNVEEYIEKGLGLGISAFGTKITLDKVPVRASRKNPMKQIVYYSLASGRDSNLSYATLEEFTANGYRSEWLGNNTRFLTRR